MGKDVIKHDCDIIDILTNIGEILILTGLGRLIFLVSCYMFYNLLLLIFSIAFTRLPSRILFGN